MTSVFDGMTGVLDGVLGASVTWTPVGGSATEIRGIFREPREVLDFEDGSNVLANAPEIHVRRPQADSIKTDDMFEPGNGKAYRVTAGHPSGGPASDAFVTFSLEVIE